MADYKGLTIKFSGDTSELEAAFNTIKANADTTQKALEYIGGGAKIGYGLMTGGKSLESFGKGLSNIGDKLTLVSAGVILAFGRNMIRQVEEFGNVVSQVGGYLQIDGERLENMRELALYVGKETQYSATEAAEAMAELAKGGLTDAQIAAGALDATMQLAAAGQMDFASAAKTTSQAIHAFQLEADDATTVADALAGAATNSVATVEGLSNGFAYAASWARNAGWDINEVSGALALLSNYGIDAEMAGTALRNFMLRLAAPTDKAAGLMKDLGIEVRDANGNMKSAVDVVDELNIALAGLSNDERDSIINTIFGVRGANAALALMDAGSQELQKYIGYTMDVGAAARMAQAQMGDLGWALEYMRGEAETAAVNFGSALEPTLIEIANTIEDLLSWFNQLTDSEREQIANTALMVVGIGPFLSIMGRVISVVGSVTSGIGATVLGFSTFVKVIRDGKDAATALGAVFQVTGLLKAEDAAAKATATLQGLNIAVETLSWSVGVGLAAALAIGTFAAFAAMLEEEKKRAEEAAEHTRKLTDATSKYEAVVSQTAPSVDNARDAYRNLGNAAKDATETFDELLDKQIELSDTFASRNLGAQQTIDNLVTAKGYIDEYGGAVSLSTEEVGKLQWALGILNQELGTNYELEYAYSGVISSEGEIVDDLAGSFDSLIDARIRNAQTAAITANLTDAMQQQSQLKAAIDQTTQSLEEAKKQQEMWYGILRSEGLSDEQRTDAAQHVYDLTERIGTLESQLSDYEQMNESVNASIDAFTEQLGEASSQIVDMDDKVKALLHSMGGDLFGQIGDRAEEFVMRLENAGVSAEQFSTLTQSQFAALVTALNADGYMMEDMLALITGNFELSTSNWGAAVEEWASGLGIEGDAAMQALADGIASGDIQVNGSLDEILEGAKGYVIQKAPEYMEPSGEEIDSSTADGIESNGGVVGDAAQRVAEYARDRMSGVDFSTSGYDMMSSFANGIWSGFSNLVTPAVNAVTQYIADNVKHSKPKTGPLSTDDVWGRHMVENFANGMRAGLPYLEREVDNMTSTLAWGLNDQSLYMSAGNGYRGGTAIYIDGNAIVTDARLQGAAESFMREVVRKSDM